MSASIKVDLTAYLPVSALKDFLQAVRSFDAEHDGCHFQFLALDPGTSLSLDEMNAMLDSIDPVFDLRATIRKPPID